MIQIRQLVKNFGPQPVLRGIDLHVPKGEFLTLFGPNGAGKTTLLRILATLGRPTAGEVKVGGWHLPNAAQKVRPHLGLISHQPLLYAELTAEENLSFFARMYGLAPAAGRIDQVLRSVDLSKRRHDPVGEFSRGMQQRLAIARSMLHDPPILLLDEPDTGLDQHAAAMLTDLLHEVGATRRTVLMTTHNLERGLELGDRVAILAGGRIAFQADKSELDADRFRSVYYQYVERAV